MKKTIQVILTLLCMFIASACGNTEIAFDGEIPGIDIPASEMNSRMTLAVPTYGNSLKIGDTIPVEIISHSDTNIKIILDQDIKVFAQFDNEWREIKNYTFYSGDIKIIRPEESDVPIAAAFPVDLALEGVDQPIIVRIIVAGIVYHGDKPTNIKTGAYLDITLSP